MLEVVCNTIQLVVIRPELPPRPGRAVVARTSLSDEVDDVAPERGELAT
jgi:hypothetical protein